MKKIILSIFFIIGFYAQAELVQVEADPEETGFFSYTLGGEVLPAQDFLYQTPTASITFGGKISQQSSFEAGLKIKIMEIQHSSLAFRYGYSFIKGSQWIPGIDVVLLVGFKRSFYKKKEETENEYTLAGGAELGPYLKTFISKSHALLLRVGVTYDTSTDDDFDLTNSRVYLNLGLQYYF